MIEKGFRLPESVGKKAPRLTMMALALLASLPPEKGRAQDLQETAMGRLIHGEAHPGKSTTPKELEAMPSVADFSDMPSHEYIHMLSKLDGTYLDARIFTEEMKQYREFCEELTHFCEHFSRRPEGVTYITQLSPDAFQTIVRINKGANEEFKPLSDEDQYKVREKWTIPGVAGDCEDYVLIKMTRLITYGFDPQDLHIIVVADDRNEGHAVLGIDVFVGRKKTTLILDNKRSEILTLAEMLKNYRGHRFTQLTPSVGGAKVQFFTFATIQE